MGFFYDGYSVLDRIGAAQYYHPINVVALPPFPRLFSPNRDYNTTCLCTSALFSAELAGSYLYL